MVLIIGCFLNHVVYLLQLSWLLQWHHDSCTHYSDGIMGAIGSQITSLTIVYSTVYSSVDQRKHQSSASLAFVRGIHRSPASNAENVSIWWRHHEFPKCQLIPWMTRVNTARTESRQTPERELCVHFVGCIVASYKDGCQYLPSTIRRHVEINYKWHCPCDIATLS